MRIGLIDVDGHNFPNLPLMKLSAWHKQQGDSVEWYDPLFHSICFEQPLDLWDAMNAGLVPIFRESMTGGGE